MPQRLKVEGQTPPEEVAAARQSRANPHDQERLLAVEMAQQGGWRIADIAKALGRGSATIGRWFDKFRQGGIPALLKRGHGARSPQLDSADQQALNKGLYQGNGKPPKRYSTGSPKNGNPVEPFGHPLLADEGKSPL